MLNNQAMKTKMAKNTDQAMKARQTTRARASNESKLASSVVKHPLSTEKAIRLMESDNKLVFVVDNDATKHDVKKAIEALFKAKVTQVRTFRTPKGEKRAYVTFAKETPAIDIATNLGMV